MLSKFFQQLDSMHKVNLYQLGKHLYLYFQNKLRNIDVPDFLCPHKKIGLKLFIFLSKTFKHQLYKILAVFFKIIFNSFRDLILFYTI